MGKKVLLVAVALVFVVALSGCGKKEKQAPAEKA